MDILFRIKEDIENKKGISYLFFIIYIFTFLAGSNNTFSIFRIIFLIMSIVLVFLSFNKYKSKSLKKAIYFIALLLILSVYYYFKEIK